MYFLLGSLNFTNLVGVLVILALSFLVLWRSRSSSSSKLKTAPEAAGAWPVIGHLPILAKSKLPHKTLASMADEFGPIFALRLGSFPVVVVSSSEIAKECFTKHDVAFSSRSRLLFFEILGYDYALFAFAPYGPYWREVRKIATLELLSNRRIKSLLNPVLASATDLAIKELHRLWSEKKDDSGRILVDLKQWFAKLTLNVILNVVADTGHYSSTAKMDEEEEQRCHEAVREFFRLMGTFTVADALPFLRWLDLGGHEKAMKRTMKELDTILSNWLEEHKRKKKVDLDKSQGDRDFMDVMISTLNGMDIAGYDADTIAKATCLAMIAGGSDTTMATLTWAISLLLNNLPILERVQGELDNHIGKQRHLIESDIANLAFLQAIVKETLRLYPASPLFGRQSTEDCIIGEYHVRKGTRMMFNLWKIQTDPRLWPDPLKFQPERFLSSHKDLDAKDHNFELLPFGGGRRICAGMSFALQSLHFVLARFLHAFDVSTPGNSPVDMSEDFGATIKKARPLEVMLAPRLPRELYDSV
ncbi:cytochrome P450 CYP82D47-like isoform X1 [Syzygium oleosum]|uniref:cytochrome P450 CYP82D47-like isoform X1 n=1 Tax=Syzygium oleosum TaxID=219896 RepID=UPI0011D2861B|nr:cytochrome P450 CYP82D47-like isoform X1 [Syzygium oleosum]